jgi:CheY-like chemotaxis protein
VAHDFNNQLATIMGCAELVRMSSTDAAVIDEANNIINAARRSSQLTGQLLAFARKGQFQSVPLDVNQLVREVAAIIERSFDRRIVIRQQLAPESVVVMGDPNQIHNALLNLALNSRDAMPDGGELSIATCIKDFDASQTAPRPQELPPGRHVQISVSDTGTGMTKDVMQHLFEPFFTTKPPGKGTGMGLAAVYGTVRNHQGAINVYSEPGHGSTFRLYLPLCAAVAQPSAQAPSPPVQQRQKHVLVVDDEPLLCQTAAGLLKALGYGAVSCRGGAEAVAYYRDHWRTVDLVILDMIMPGMSGRETYRELRRINPAVRVLLSSGFSINGEAQAILDEGVQGFLQKPYTVQDLSVIVSKVLNQAT